MQYKSRKNGYRIKYESLENTFLKESKVINQKLTLKQYGEAGQRYA